MSGIEYRKFITAREPLKALVKKISSKSGRNNSGRITVRHQGGGAKRQYRLVDFKQNTDKSAKVEAIEYDPYRTAFIARVLYSTGERSYVLAPNDLKVGELLVQSSGEGAVLKIGARLQLKDIPVGSFVYSVELNPGGGGKLARSAGTSVKVMAREGGYVNLQLPSGEVRQVVETCRASVGSVSNPESKMVVWGKAGRVRFKGVRPTVRGTAMNPVDHPHGGGEGRQPRGLKRSKNYWGKGVRGVKTRKRKNRSNVFIVQRRK